MNSLPTFQGGPLVPRREDGATATEYALLVSFIALALVLGVTFFGTELNALFNSFATSLAAVL